MLQSVGGGANMLTMDAVAGMSDAELEAGLKMVAERTGAGALDLPPGGARKAMEALAASYGGIGNADNREAISLSCDAPNVVQTWTKARRLPVPAAVRAAAGVRAGSELTWHVNPTAFHAAPPYMQPGEAGGFDAPWRMLSELYDLPVVAKGVPRQQDERGVDLPYDEAMHDVAARIYGATAAALRLLTGAGALKVTIDAGDVFTAPCRLLGGDTGGDAAMDTSGTILEDANAQAGHFDRIHLSNVPDYVRARLLRVRDAAVFACIYSCIDARGSDSHLKAGKIVQHVPLPL